jgi:hypothetical protein
MEERVSSLAAGPAASGEAAGREIVEGEMREPRTLKDLTLDEMNAHWEAVKRILP